MEDIKKPNEKDTEKKDVILNETDDDILESVDTMSVGDLMYGYTDNMPDDEIDNEIKLFTKLGKYLGEKDYDKIRVFVDTDGEYEPSSYSFAKKDTSAKTNKDGFEKYVIDDMKIAKDTRNGNTFLYFANDEDFEKYVEKVKEENKQYEGLELKTEATVKHTREIPSKTIEWKEDITLPEVVGATLLSVEEAKEYLTKDEREYDCWWLLCSSGRHVHLTAIVYDFGYIDDDGNDMTYFDVAIRPALKIRNLESSNLQIGDTFEFGADDFKIISDDLAWMYNSDIGICTVRKDWKASDVNNYEKSDAKKLVDNWFNSNIDEYNRTRIADDSLYDSTDYDFESLQLKTEAKDSDKNTRTYLNCDKTEDIGGHKMCSIDLVPGTKSNKKFDSKTHKITTENKYYRVKPEYDNLPLIRRKDRSNRGDILVGDELYTEREVNGLKDRYFISKRWDDVFDEIDEKPSNTYKFFGARKRMSNESLELKTESVDDKGKIEVGMIVRYAPEWCSPGERKYLHVVKENHLNPVTNEMTRWLIQTINSKLSFAPTEEVDEEMIEPTGFSIFDFESPEEAVAEIETPTTESLELKTESWLSDGNVIYTPVYIYPSSGKKNYSYNHDTLEEAYIEAIVNGYGYISKETPHYLIDNPKSGDDTTVDEEIISVQDAEKQLGFAIDERKYFKTDDELTEFMLDNPTWEGGDCDKGFVAYHITNLPNKNYESLKAEKIVKKKNGKYTNRGKSGKEHGEFKTKKGARKQQKAMFANGYKGEALELKTEGIDNREKIVIYNRLGDYYTTPESNYNSRISDARKDHRMNGFNSANEIIDYYIKYGWADSEDDFIVIDDTAKSVGEALELKVESITDPEEPTEEFEDLTTDTDKKIADTVLKNVNDDNELSIKFDLVEFKNENDAYTMDIMSKDKVYFYTATTVSDSKLIDDYITSLTDNLKHQISVDALTGNEETIKQEEKETPKEKVEESLKEGLDDGEIDRLVKALQEKFDEVALSKSWGFETIQDVRDYLGPVIEYDTVTDNPEFNYRIEVRMESPTFDAQMEMSQELDEVLASMGYADSYFDSVTYGIIETYVKVKE